MLGNKPQTSLNKVNRYNLYLKRKIKCPTDLNNSCFQARLDDSSVHNTIKKQFYFMLRGKLFDFKSNVQIRNIKKSTKNKQNYNAFSIVNNKLFFDQKNRNINTKLNKKTRYNKIKKIQFMDRNFYERQNKFLHKSMILKVPKTNLISFH